MCSASNRLATHHGVVAAPMKTKPGALYSA
jgi:hypothetical protein